jgi:hypothetical protein
MNRKYTPRPGWTEAETAKMKAMFQAGRTREEIAQAMGRTYSAVSGKVRLVFGTDHPIGAGKYKAGRKRKKPTRRVCLCCDRTFPSEGIYNRVCGRCRDRREFRDGDTRPPMEVNLTHGGQVMRKGAA